MHYAIRRKETTYEQKYTFKCQKDLHFCSVSLSVHFKNTSVTNLKICHSNQGFKQFSIPCPETDLKQTHRIGRKDTMKVRVGAKLYLLLIIRGIRDRQVHNFTAN